MTVAPEIVRLAQQASTGGLGFGESLGLLVSVVVAGFVLVWTVRRLVGMLGRLLPQRLRTSPVLERNVLVGISGILSLSYGASTTSGLSTGVAPDEVGGLVIAGVIASVVIHFTFIQPIVLIISPAYRRELRLRVGGNLEKAFRVRGWRSFRGGAAVLFVVFFWPVYLFTAVIPASIAYLRGRAGTYVHRQKQAAPPRVRLPDQARRTAREAAERVVEQAQQALDRSRASTPSGGPMPTERAPRPAPAPAGPRHEPDPRPAARSAERPREPQAEPERPRRRWWHGSGGAATGADGAQEPKEPRFKTRSGGDGQTQLTARRRTVKDDDGDDIDLVEIGIEAAFRVPRAGSPVVQVIELLDVTDSARAPVAVHQWGGDVLRTAGPVRIESQSTVPHATARLSRTVPIALPGLHAPFKGDRTLRAQFTMHRPRSSGQPLTQGWVEFPYREKVAGYVEAPRMRLRIEAGIVTAGYAAAMADGRADAAEVRLLEEFVAERHKRLRDDGTLAIASRAALDDARMRAQSGSSARELLQQAGRDLAGVEEGPRVSAYELAVRIVAVDGRITEAELARLNELAEVLELDAEKTASLRNRHTNVSMFEGSGVDPLGVPPGTPDEQRRFLKQQLKMWRSVQTNPDPAKQEQAREMIDRISQRLTELGGDRAGTA